MIFFKFLFIVFTLFFLNGCSIKSAFEPHKEIADLKNIPQDALFYTQNMQEANISHIHNNFEKSYFRAWNEDIKEDLNSIMWSFRAFKFTNSYGENLRPLKQNFFDEMLENSNFPEYKTLNAKAITTKQTDVRVFPTIKPLFKNPSLAGEGFPFDYLQNSTICANKPILISHYSKDKEWAYVFSGFVSGWVKTDNFAILSDADAELLQRHQQIAIVKENIPIYDENHIFLFKSKIGMMFGLLDEDEDSYTIATIASEHGSKALFLKSKIAKSIAYKDRLHIEPKSISLVTNELYKNNYGWGGLYEQRDCSSMIRDMFTPFGIWLPRNSYAQSRIGKVIDMKNMSDEEKIRTIKQNAIPFQTLLYRKGHIVLYVGTYNDEIIVFHNTWGIRTIQNGVEGRHIVGKAIFSTLKLGKEVENYDTNAELLKNLLSMNTITH
ncbi:MAG: hypothetical protein QG559_1475 [Campylobacterota bacterium]|nr:hypothetical protein [Campylobacterota bacterium]